MAYSGKYHPNNPDKYNGDSTNIVYRSLWERKFMQYCDNNPSIIKWSSEEVIIPYRSPIDNKVHRYFMDFWIVAKGKDGSIKEQLIEIKPYKEKFPPKKPKRQTKRYLNECRTYAVNQAKWDAAKRYAKKHGMEFKVVTEYELGLKRGN